MLLVTAWEEGRGSRGLNYYNPDNGYLCLFKNFLSKASGST
jgi:hypothetical protein